jgi:hypothetical protein
MFHYLLIDDDDGLSVVGEMMRYQRLLQLRFGCYRSQCLQCCDDNGIDIGNGVSGNVMGTGERTSIDNGSDNDNDNGDDNDDNDGGSSISGDDEVTIDRL